MRRALMYVTRRVSCRTASKTVVVGWPGDARSSTVMGQFTKRR
jgi:hypothetical protein